MFSVVAPSGDEQKLAEQGQELLKAAAALGFNLHAEGFLYAWVDGVRVIVDRDEEDNGTIVGMLLMACGARWIEDDFTASVLGAMGRDEHGLVEYARNIAAALGATSLFVESGLSKQQEDGSIHRTVIEYKVQ